MYVYRQDEKQPRFELPEHNLPECIVPESDVFRAYEATPGVAWLSVSTWRDIRYVRRHSIVHA